MGNNTQGDQEGRTKEVSIEQVEKIKTIEETDLVVHIYVSRWLGNKWVIGMVDHRRHGTIYANCLHILFPGKKSTTQ